MALCFRVALLYLACAPAENNVDLVLALFRRSTAWKTVAGSPLNLIITRAECAVDEFDPFDTGEWLYLVSTKYSWKLFTSSILSQVPHNIGHFNFFFMVFSRVLSVVIQCGDYINVFSRHRDVVASRESRCTRSIREILMFRCFILMFRIQWNGETDVLQQVSRGSFYGIGGESVMKKMFTWNITMNALFWIFVRILNFSRLRVICETNDGELIERVL